MAEIANMGYVVDEAQGTYWADWADRTDETDVAEMALRMHAQFYFDCLGHKEFKGVAHIGLWEPYHKVASTVTTRLRKDSTTLYKS